MKAAQQLSREPFPRFPGKIPGLGGSRNKTCIYPRIHHAKGTPMDLRRRLLTRLGLLLGGLLAVAMLVQLHSLRSDIESEVAASARLVEVLLAAGTAAPDAAAPLADGALRHLSIRPAGQAAVTTPPPSWLSWLGLVPEVGGERQLRIGERSLVIAPKPGSEIDERLGDTVRLLITLLLFSGASLLVAWFAADRALAPVRGLEAGLERLARGEADPALPPFALREFSRVADAIEHLAAELQEARAAQRALARQLIEVQEAERSTLARELHDDMGQSLTALNVTAAYLERNAGRLDAGGVADCAADLRRDIRSCGEQLRGILATLRPHGLEAAGLAEALQDLVDGWRSRETGIEFALDLPPAPLPVDEPKALALYRVIQEALTNVVRHSGAESCRVSLAVLGQRLEACIADDGRGLHGEPERRGGLLGMAERMDMAGGQLALSGGTGRGLCVTAWVPCAGASATA